MRPTPRTDAMKFRIPIVSDQGLSTGDYHLVVAVEDASTLERELAEAVEVLNLLEFVMRESVKVGCTDHLDCWVGCPWYHALDQTRAFLAKLEVKP